jgi:hypothetical protein
MNVGFDADPQTEGGGAVVERGCIVMLSCGVCARVDVRQCHACALVTRYDVHTTRRPLHHGLDGATGRRCGARIETRCGLGVMGVCA